MAHEINPLFVYGTVTTNGDGLSQEQVAPHLFDPNFKKNRAEGTIKLEAVAPEAPVEEEPVVVEEAKEEKKPSRPARAPKKADADTTNDDQPAGDVEEADGDASA